MTNPDDLISVKDAAEILDVTPRMVRYLITRGKLPGKKVTNRDWVLSRKDVEDYLAKKEVSKGDDADE